MSAVELKYKFTISGKLFIQLLYLKYIKYYLYELYPRCFKYNYMRVSDSFFKEGCLSKLVNIEKTLFRVISIRVFIGILLQELND